MRRVVITGLGIVSCLGTDKASVSANLRASRPGIRFNPSYAEMGLRSQVSGSIDLNLEELIDRKVYRFMGDAAARSEERRVGKECRSRWAPQQVKKNSKPRHTTRRQC